ncbi:hypothetical protein Q5424_05175 [Conexibacter sp. JD483]|uniref:hypothetical protein n=1 Tax=unclassified Conexibacter TaxID=2627773 RepID=UPI00272688CB|nr:MULTISPECIES: hypothetical protein [unclassified Conexibacter]MDO8186724.1 hypothetical protein [Conexibacter sp. CPCC 205706]MDO8199010.1 hypothetical protein [Conexibacter sp. CPCC 205762]MDR9368462.1 hypothetical protein [Conexibacter sp. JD483]
MRRVAGTLAAIVAALALAGCGAESDDVFLVRRTGALPDARVDIVVNDGGTVTCDRGASRELDSKLLLRSRDVVRTLDERRLLGRVHPPSPRAQLRYELRTGFGDITFNDVDAVGEPELGRTIQLVRELAQQACGLAR